MLSYVYTHTFHILFLTFSLSFSHLIQVNMTYFPQLLQIISHFFFLGLKITFWMLQTKFFVSQNSFQNHKRIHPPQTFKEFPHRKWYLASFWNVHTPCIFLSSLLNVF